MDRSHQRTLPVWIGRRDDRRRAPGSQSPLRFPSASGPRARACASVPERAYGAGAGTPAATMEDGPTFTAPDRGSMKIIRPGGFSDRLPAISFTVLADNRQL